MTHHVLREKIEENRENVFFYKERRVGFYQFTNIKSETIVNAIKDVLDLIFNPKIAKGKHITAPAICWAKILPLLQE